MVMVMLAPPLSPVGATSSNGSRSSRRRKGIRRGIGESIIHEIDLQSHFQSRPQCTCGKIPLNLLWKLPWPYIPSIHPAACSVNTHINGHESTQVLKMNRHKSPAKKSTLRPVKLPQLNNPHEIVSISLLCLRSSNERLTMHTRRDAGGGCVARAGHRQDLITA